MKITSASLAYQGEKKKMYMIPEWIYTLVMYRKMLPYLLPNIDDEECVYCHDSGRWSNPIFRLEFCKCKGTMQCFHMECAEKYFQFLLSKSFRTTNCRNCNGEIKCVKEKEKQNIFEAVISTLTGDLAMVVLAAVGSHIGYWHHLMDERFRLTNMAYTIPFIIALEVVDLYNDYWNTPLIVKACLLFERLGLGCWIGLYLYVAYMEWELLACVCMAPVYFIASFIYVIVFIFMAASILRSYIAELEKAMDQCSSKSLYFVGTDGIKIPLRVRKEYY